MIQSALREIRVQFEINADPDTLVVAILVRPDVQGEFEPVVEQVNLSTDKPRRLYKAAMRKLERRLNARFTGSEGADSYVAFAKAIQHLGQGFSVPGVDTLDDTDRDAVAQSIAAQSIASVCGGERAA